MRGDRCNKETKFCTMSKFNEDTICPDCEEREINHPKYEEAARAEFEAVRAGNLNFPGIGAPADLYQPETTK